MTTNNSQATKTLALAIALSLGFSALPIAAQNDGLPVQEVQPKPITESEINAQIEELQSRQNRNGNPLFGNELFQNNTRTSPEDLAHQLRLAENPELEGYIDSSGNYIGAQLNQAATNPFLESIRKQYRPEQTYNLKARGNQAIPVGAGLMNAIQTNFESVTVRTSDNHSIIEVEDGYLYVTINSMEPVGLIIYEDGVPESQVSIVLVPGSTPPAMVTVNVEMTQLMIMKGRKHREDIKKHQMELDAQRTRLDELELGGRQSGHTRRIVDLLRPVAKGQLPSGFSLSVDIPQNYQHPCRVAIEHHTGQRLNGGHEVIDVVVMHNNTNRPYQVREEMCLSEDVVAVAISQASYLQPGEETEVYILRDKTYEQEKARQNTRPRLTGRGK